MSEQAKRVGSLGEIDEAVVCYFHHEGEWWIYLPCCGAGRLPNHTIEEHDDRTISVTPSILLTGHKDGERTQRHGYLTRGVWNEC